MRLRRTALSAPRRANGHGLLPAALPLAREDGVRHHKCPHVPRARRFGNDACTACTRFLEASAPPCGGSASALALAAALWRGRCLEERLDGLSLVGGARLLLPPAVQPRSAGALGGAAGAANVGRSPDVPARHSRGLVDRKSRRDGRCHGIWCISVCAATLRHLPRMDDHRRARRTHGTCRACRRPR